MKRLIVVGSLLAACGAALVFANRSAAQEAEQLRTARIVAEFDITEILKKLDSLEAQVGELRRAIADPKGLRADLAEATTAVKAMEKRLAELNAIVAKQAEDLEPVITTLDPATRWEYRCLRTRSESVVNRLGREGWQLVTASGDWLYFRRPAAGAQGEK